jgi:hypothetical protein
MVLYDLTCEIRVGEKEDIDEDAQVDAERKRKEFRIMSVLPHLNPLIMIQRFKVLWVRNYFFTLSTHGLIIAV